jgi:subtilisin family serine protease
LSRRLLPVLLVACAVAASLAGSGSARIASSAAAGPSSYIVVLKNDVASPAAVANEQATKHGFRTEFVYSHALKGYAAKLPAAALERIKQDPRVDYVEADVVNQVDTTQVTPPGLWGLDRIDQRNLPLSGTYSYTTMGSGVTAYGIDTGIRTTHVDFGGRAVSGFDAIDGGTADDCHGHGTHTAATIGGTTYGVAKGVLIKAVRVLNCAGSGTTSQVVAGVDWVTGDHLAGQRAVANMSLGGPIQPALDAAVKAAISDGIVFAVSAGNSAADACNQSPARVASAITVAASSITDGFASFSNRGPCVDIIAPGVNVQSAWKDSDISTNILSGTSMASPHIAGIAARAWQFAPTSGRSGIVRKVKNQATVGAVTGVPAGTVNKLAFWDQLK